MAFTIQSWSPLTSTANAGVRTLSDGSYIGGPAPFSYANSGDTVAQISAAGYFNEVGNQLSVYDRIHVVGSDGIIDLRVDGITFSPSPVVTTTTTLGLGDVNGPAAAVDMAVTRFDGITGKVIQSSGVILSDADGLTGITNLTVDNLNINGNSIISENVNGNISLTPNGVGINVLANCRVTNVTASRAVVTDASSNLNESVTTATELSYVNGVTSAIQTQIDALIASIYQRSVNKVGHGFTVGEVLYMTTPGGVYTEAQADSDTTSDTIGIVASVTDADNFVVQMGGFVTGLTGLTVGATYYLSEATAGLMRIGPPTATGTWVIKPLFIAETTTSGYWLNQVGIEKVIP